MSSKIETVYEYDLIIKSRNSPSFTTIDLKKLNEIDDNVYIWYKDVKEDLKKIVEDLDDKTL